MQIATDYTLERSMVKEESAKGDTQFARRILDLNLTSMPKIIPSPNKALAGK